MAARLFAVIVSFFALPHILHAQTDSGLVTVRVNAEGRPLSGAAIVSSARRAITDATGAASLTLPLGPQSLLTSHLGFAPETLHVTIGSEPIVASVTLHEAAVTLAQVVIASTRNERRVADEPTRVEITDREDVEEQIGGSPGIIAELLTESGGVRVQRTSPGSSGATVRIRGMRGRYTKILSDGLPLFGVTTEGLGTLQIPPIDLQRVEVIKGVASALYGPTALGGVVNLVSERPTSQREMVANQTTRNGRDGVLWETRTLNPDWGYTLVAGAHQQDTRDDDNDGWADINGFRRFLIRPRLFWSDERGSSWFVTSGFTTEDRTGGTFGPGRLPNGQPYRDDAETRRADVGSVARVAFGPATVLHVRGSATRESRTHWRGSARERQRRNALFGELSFTTTRARQVLVAGAAVERDDFDALDVPIHDYTFSTPALFVEHTWSPSEQFATTASARADFHSAYGDFVSPRLSVLVRPAQKWNARLSLGSGVYAPTPFTEETEAIDLARLQKLALAAERAAGVSADVGGTVGVMELIASAHLTDTKHPIALRAVPGPAMDVELVNAAEPTRTRGVELYARSRTDPIHVKASYTFIDATELDVETGTRRTVPLNPRHSAGLTAVYEAEHDWIVGVESYYNGWQSLADNPYRTVSKAYITIDALIQKQLGHLIVFVHGEDLNAVRQTHWDPILRPAPGPGRRWTTDVWAPLEGAVINGGFRLQY